MNRVELIGRLTKDPELKYTQGGIPMSRFTLAVNKRKQQNQQEQQANFINCIAWRKQAESLVNFQRKGALIAVEGHIETGSYDGQDGKRVYTTDVIADNITFLESRKPQDGSGQYQQQQQGYNAQPQQNYQVPPGQHQQYQAPPAGQPSYQQQYQVPPQQQYPPNSYSNPPYR